MPPSAFLGAGRRAPQEPAHDQPPTRDVLQRARPLTATTKPGRHPIRVNYVLFVTACLIMGGALFASVRWWHAYLVRLAEKHDIPARRKIAAGWYPLTALFLLGLMCFTWIYSAILLAPEMRRRPGLHILILVGFLSAILPAVMWWARGWKALTALGYGRPRGRR